MRREGREGDAIGLLPNQYGDVTGGEPGIRLLIARRHGRLYTACHLLHSLLDSILGAGAQRHCVYSFGMRSSGTLLRDNIKESTVAANSICVVAVELVYTEASSVAEGCKSCVSNAEDKGEAHTRCSFHRGRGLLVNDEPPGGEEGLLILQSVVGLRGAVRYMLDKVKRTCKISKGLQLYSS
ncbi:hypothetical protein MUK42_07491 [Musa troglodytarum]|uniref:Uncharacterized protein n=1 Tax=Musa troglodytarum TaxID=320322 RepID=A0A9E7GR78_9LILI|nr:hypothetical protein MUK42_07491 [Musa troglodytarum]